MGGSERVGDSLTFLKVWDQIKPVFETDYIPCNINFLTLVRLLDFVILMYNLVYMNWM